MSFTATLIVTVAVLLTAVWFLRAASRRMAKPEAIRSAIDAHYQERLSKAGLDQTKSYEFDFVFSTSTVERAQVLVNSLAELGYTSTIEETIPSEEWIVEAKCEISAETIDFAKFRAKFQPLCESGEVNYIGPGARGLALIGVNLPA